MATYKRGIETKNSIYKVAKELFYYNGYKETSLSTIAENASVPLSLVTYHYKKDELLIQAHEDYFNSVMDTIELQAGQQIENALQRLLIYMQIVYSHIYSDFNNLRAFQIYQQNREGIKNMKQRIDFKLLDCIDEFDLDILVEEFKCYIDVQYGGHKELIAKYLKTHTSGISKELLYFTGTIALRLARVDFDVINDNIKKADKLLEYINTETLHLFL